MWQLKTIHTIIMKLLYYNYHRVRITKVEEKQGDATDVRKIDPWKHLNDFSIHLYRNECKFMLFDNKSVSSYKIIHRFVLIYGQMVPDMIFNE